jgi:hypothetical protein
MNGVLLSLFLGNFTEMTKKMTTPEDKHITTIVLCFCRMKPHLFSFYHTVCFLYQNSQKMR